MPESEVWKELVKNDFKDYELKIKEILEHPVELSVDDLKRIALSLKVYTEKSDRKKDTPLQ